MKAHQIRELDLADLAKKELALKEELFNLRVQLATGQLENLKKLGLVRKDIARVKTILKEKQRSEKAPSGR
ncbi:MAG: 50S ribosomal protein L29 [Deltaproteobacteria bacterium]|nr:50S ribosomal protein L29 [Deltaproteobacteria bacterium]